MSQFRLGSAWVWSTLVVLAVSGCDSSTSELGKKVEEQAQQASQSLAGEAEKLMEQGGDMAKELGQQALGFLGPLKDKLSGLDGLKDKPEELKTSVTELLKSLESNVANLPLPDGLKETLAQLKEKLEGLQEYLGGAIEPAKLQEYLDAIKDFVGKQMG